MRKYVYALGVAAFVIIGTPDVIRAHGISISSEVQSNPKVSSYLRESQIQPKEIWIEAAAMIARKRGMFTVTSIRLVVENYIVRGFDLYGHVMRIVIDARSGRVRKVERRV
jgi:DNA-binding protein